MAPAGALTLDAFKSCFASLLRGQTQEDATRASVVLERMFQIFDENNDGVVDAAEFLSGLSVLVGGDRACIFVGLTISVNSLVFD